MYSPAGVQRRSQAATTSSMPDERDMPKVAVSPEWRTSINYAILTLLHLVVCGFVTFLLLLLLPKASQPPIERDPGATPGPHDENRDARVVRIWATALGLLSTILAVFQYMVSLRAALLRYRCTMKTDCLSVLDDAATNRSDMAEKTRRLTQYTDDVYTNARLVRLRLLSDGQTRRELDSLDRVSDQ